MTDYRQLVVRLEKCFEAFMAALADFTELCDHAAADRARLNAQQREIDAFVSTVRYLQGEHERLEQIRSAAAALEKHISANYLGHDCPVCWSNPEEPHLDDCELAALQRLLTPKPAEVRAILGDPHE